MVKFILEVSEDFINEGGDLMHIMKTQDDTAHGFVLGLTQLLAFSHIKGALADGQKEFVLNRDNIKDEKELKLYDNAIRDVAFLCNITSKDKED